MKTLCVEVPDDIYQAFQQEAARTGQSVEIVARDCLVLTAPPLRMEMTEEQRKEAHARFLRHFGSVNSGNPRSADNEQIDADLAREYGDSHEEAIELPGTGEK